LINCQERSEEKMEMSRTGRKLLTALAAGVCCWSMTAHAAPAEVTVLSAGAVQDVIGKLAVDFRDRTGRSVTLSVGTVGALIDRVAAGETADIVIVTSQAMAELVNQGKVAPETVVEVGKVGVGVAIREGAPLPDILTADAFRQTLLAAKSLVYADPAKGASSGIYFATVLERLGIAAAVKDKTTLLPGGFVVELVAQGKAEIGIHQITEILPVKGVVLAGPLPPELQKITAYSAAVMTGAANASAAGEFLRFVTGPEAAPSFTAAGFGRF
jgi:molybdate transport system substrate-binding protein